MNQDAATKATLEVLYRVLLLAVVQLAAVLGKECPVETRATRRHNRYNGV